MVVRVNLGLLGFFFQFSGFGLLGFRKKDPRPEIFEFIDPGPQQEAMLSVAATAKCEYFQSVDRSLVLVSGSDFGCPCKLLSHEKNTWPSWFRVFFGDEKCYPVM